MRFGIPGEDETVKEEAAIAGGPLDGFDGAVEAECELGIGGVGRGRDDEEDVASGAQTGRARGCIGVARRLASRWQGLTVILLDRHKIVSADTQRDFDAIGWRVETVAADVFEFLQQDNPTDVDVITTNLFLHHFPQAELARLLALAAQWTDVLAACEPSRAPLALAASQMVWAIGCNDVSRHDAVVSVRAGFNGDEISALWPKRKEWELHEWPAMLFTHCFVARRTGRTPQ